MRGPTPFALPAQPTRGRDLVSLGISKRRINTAVVSGRLMRLRRGVYLDPARWPTEPMAQHLLRAQAEQAFQPDAVVSHRSAAAVWGLPLSGEDWLTEPVWITLPSGGGFRSERSAQLIQQTATLPPHHVAVSDDLRLTSPARTAVDLVKRSELAEALVILDAVLRILCRDMLLQPRRRDFANQRLIAAAKTPVLEAIDRLGVARARPFLDYAEPTRETPVESLSFGYVVVAELPLPTCQAPVQTPIGTLYPDFLWPERRLIGEVDGRIKYTDAEVMMREKAREQVLRDLGFQIVRWTGREIRLQPQVVMARIARALNA